MIIVMDSLHLLFISYTLIVKYKMDRLFGERISISIKNVVVFCYLSFDNTIPSLLLYFRTILLNAFLFNHFLLPLMLGVSASYFNEKDRPRHPSKLN